MLLQLFVGLIAFCNCQVPEAPEAKEMTYVCIFNSPIYAYGKESQAVIDTSRIEVERVSDSEASVSGIMELKEEIPEGVMLEITVLKECSGGFEVLYSLDICDLCKEMADEGSVFRPELDGFGLPTICPIQTGFYNVTNYLVDIAKIMKLSAEHVGGYEAQLSLCLLTGDNCKQDKKCMCVLKMDLTVEELLD